MSQPDLFTSPLAIQARRSGLAEGRRLGATLRERYVDLLKAHGPLTDHEAGALLGALSTTVGARRKELMAALPSCIEAVERVVVPAASRASRTRWRWAR